MSVVSICLYCGEDKILPLDDCPYCKHCPSKKEDCLKSMVLSFDENEGAINILPKEKFLEYSEQIKIGKPPVFSKKVLGDACDIFDDMNEVTGKKLVIYLIKFGWPILIPIVVILYTLNVNN